MGCVRGFFLANRAPLPYDRHKFRSDKVPVVAEMNVEDLRKVIVASNVTMAAAFMVQFQSGSGRGELCYINENHAVHVWDEVRRGARVIRLVMPGRKSKRNIQPYYSFIGLDAIELLKRVFHSRGWKRDAVLFRTKRGDPITPHSIQKYFRDKAFQLGLIKPKTPPCLDCKGETVKHSHRLNGKEKTFYLCVKCGLDKRASEYGLNHKVLSGIRYRMKTHEVRDLFRTEWHRAQRMFGVDADVGRFMMGHTIDSLKYDKIMKDVEATTAEFRKAMPMFNILSEDPRKISRSEVQEQLEASEAKVDVLSKEVAELRREHKDIQAVRDNLPLLLELVDKAKKKEKRTH